MSTHTKRSPEFKAKIEQLMGEISRMNGMRGEGKKGDFIQEIYEILRDNTTDSACMVKAKDDEPVFVLRGQDFNAEDTVGFWINITESRLRGGNKPHPARRVKDLPAGHIKAKRLSKLNDARICQAEMRAYPNRKMPD